MQVSFALCVPRNRTCQLCDSPHITMVQTGIFLLGIVSLFHSPKEAS